MDAWAPVSVTFAVSNWLIDPDQVRSSTLLFLTLIGIGLLAGALYFVGIIDWLLWLVGALIRGGTRTGFRVWEQCLSWASWPLFLAVQLVLLTSGALVAEALPGLTVMCALAPLAMGLAACLAYMFIDVERYEVARGYKALHNPLKGQKLAAELARYGHQVEVPLLGSAAVGMIGGFALLNFGLFEMFGTKWYSSPAPDPIYSDFIASALVHLLSVVDLLNLADTHHLARVVVARPAAAPASTLLTLFKSFFTLVLLQQIFASVRNGRLLTETVADFWSPHEPIHERARSALPQYGAVALGPLLLSLRATDTLTREQRDQLPHVLATIGPVAVPSLIAHLDDPNEHVRAVAISTLGRLRAAAGLPQMIARAQDSSDLVRLSLAQALGEIVSTTTPTLPRARRRRGEWRVWRVLAVRRWNTPPHGDPVALVVPALRAALRDSAASVRAAATASLGQLGPAHAAEVTPDLLGLLADTDETVRERATEALGRLGASDSASVAALTGLLQDPSPAIRIAAARALGSLRAAACDAVSHLVPLLQDRDEAVRTAAAEAVSKIGTLCEAATSTLAEALTSADNVVRARTAEALGTIGGAAAEVAPVLVEAVADENDRVRAKAVEALGKIGEAAAEVAVPRLVHALRDPDNWVSALAAEALGEMGAAADEAVPALMRSLKHPNTQVRTNAAEALGKLGAVARPAVSALERAATDEDGGVRARAVRALGEVGTPTPVTTNTVRTALADPDPHTRAAAVDAFGAWGQASDEVQNDLLALLDDANDEVKVRVVRVLPRLVQGTPAVIEALDHRLTADDSDWVRAEAARALGQFGAAATPAGPALLRAAQTGEAGLREEAMRALVVAQPPEAATAFTTGLRDAEPSVRKLASAGWRKAAEIPEEAVPVLIEALHDPEVQVRANAAHAISRLDPVPAEAVPLLAECALAPDAGLRLNAALALQAAPGQAAADALHPLLDDPNPRLRLIAARRLFTDDPADATTATAVAEALVAPASSVRQAAFDLIESIHPAAPATLKVLRDRTATETDSDVTQLLNEAIARLEPLVASEPQPPEGTASAEVDVPVIPAVG
ncbi:heat-repeat-containing pbs lyase : HEAT repeat-containing protein OS=Singulisphaera acidiphila (strain ATCC BAA-1392 / DSM 18658 / VKM B-2454 / MOB10) GN=Sinac_5393 PE=4 SV=1: HEAT_2: HEAT: HEAT_2: HEAT_EZ: HEAT_2: HEAT_2: HEAT_2 [Gemmata massiliana]|uniref:TOG domain-containing protein n=1 Tax=Gemmata massiliana TaxID=1210884 RepID=A0A6P2CY23_9BACT|nr:HEAT repeat domain-containing protein [Gemmata massiliana]VTR93447.1 heat-repeat-containing pbs lyase : HEAT repeat-containing protein OS=Singulisphaera acidiphila (strain ATCC BAA-1392 / DSM 18658 / VKM B-2454 / MOB10) GN=Sinac_5393 PE=4 SV=1: HEAT_2: HEAT: HEAT_2: HEAT_EZ: HEAT_2: HEAT_2: HEAT_2 [Gemmata massiliana]